MRKLLLVILYILLYSSSSLGYDAQKIKEKTITCEIYKKNLCGIANPNCTRQEIFRNQFIKIDFKNKTYQNGTNKYKISNVSFNLKDPFFPSIQINFGAGNYTEIFMRDDWDILGIDPLSKENLNSLYNKKGFFKEMRGENLGDLISVSWGLCRF